MTSPTWAPHSEFCLAEPQFGDAVAHEAAASRPRQLFCALSVDPEEHRHYLEPAYRWLISVLEAAPLPVLGGAPEAGVEELLGWARDTLRPVPLCHFAPSWPARVVREFAPVGTSDGAWLRGAVRAPAVESDLGLCLLQQLSVRLGGPTKSEGHPYRYAALLASVGVPPGSITRWDWDEMAPCADISHEHGLLGLALGFFPTALLPETIGFNLWMSTLGPAPLLERLADELRNRRAQLRYLERYDRARLAPLARDAVRLAGAATDVKTFVRIARGFAAAHQSYLRWEQAMLGPNVPFTPWDSVLEMMRRKARFAAEHHRDVRLARRSVEALLRDGGAAHEWLVEKLAASRLIRAGDPDGSRFMNHSLSMEGPMFDAFTPGEKLDLRAWIETIGTRDELRTQTPAISLQGRYGAPQDAASLTAFAVERYAHLPEEALFTCLLHADLHPALPAFIEPEIETMLEAVAVALNSDERLRAVPPPSYSERAVLALLEPSVGVALANGPIEAAATPAFDGWWLHGSCDVRRAGFDDSAWLFGIYVAKYATGERPWAECREVRQAASERLCRALIGRGTDSDERLLTPRRLALASLALGLNAQRFTPEVLGLTLGAASLATASEARQGEASPDASFAIPDATKRWAAWATQAFIQRVRDAAPSAVQRQWERVWRAWRVVDILARGAEADRATLLRRLRSAAERSPAEASSSAVPLRGARSDRRAQNIDHRA
jgi:hypothetical protein